MKFLIRDDDTCAFTSVEELENCYGGIGPEIPICLSITPFRIPGRYFNSNRKNQELPLAANKELVGYLRDSIKAGKYDIALHGYNHIYYSDFDKKSRVPEYAVSADLGIKTKDGIEYLQEVLGPKVNTFVPPSNQISKHGIEVIVDNKLNLMNIPGFRPSHRPYYKNILTNYVKLKYWKLRYEHCSYPFILDYGRYCELGSQLLYPNAYLNSILKNLEIIRKYNGIFVLAIHYNAFHKRLKSGETISYALNKILEVARNYQDIEFVSYKDIW